MPTRPLGSRFSRQSIIAFGTWTVLTQFMVLTGGTPRQLTYLAGALLIVLAGRFLYRRGNGPPRQETVPAQPSGEPELTSEHLTHTPALLFFFLGSSVLILLALTTSLEVFAIALAIVAAGILLFEVRQPPVWTPPYQSPRGERALLVFALAMAILASIAHRPDADDAMYLNMATTVADYPDRALLSFDGTLPDPDVPLPEVAYRAHSLEVLVGILSSASGLSAISILHIGIAFWAALLAVFAQAELQKILVPNQWLLGTIVAVLVLLALGETHRGYGNFSFVRMHQGKGILLTAVIPLLIAYALRFMRTPSGENWWLLLITMIAASGVSSSGLIIAPIAAVLALFSAWSPHRGATRNLACGLMTGLYPATLAFLLGLVWR